MKKEKLSATRLEIEFEDGLEEAVTARAGVALLVETGRRSGVIATADRVLPAKKKPHRVLKDELGAGVYPSGKFGANAAWLRLQVLTNNLLVLMKATTLDEEYRKARPKRLRFAIFNHLGRVVHLPGRC